MKIVCFSKYEELALTCPEIVILSKVSFDERLKHFCYRFLRTRAGSKFGLTSKELMLCSFVSCCCCIR